MNAYMELEEQTLQTLRNLVSNNTDVIPISYFTRLKVGQWTSWGKCDQTCSVGTKQRTRVVTVTQRCRGNSCPPLKVYNRKADFFKNHFAK